MRVGVIGPMGPDLFADNVGDALQRTGHQVIQLGAARGRPLGGRAGNLVQFARQGMPGLDEWAQRRIVRSAVNAECQVVLCLDAQLMPGAVSQLKHAGMRVAFWFPDALSRFGRALMLLAPYDALFFKEPHLVGRLQSIIDTPVYYLPQACNPRWHRPIVPAGTERHIVIAGNMYPSRIRLLERLVAKGIPLKLYGAGFPRWLGESSVRALHTGKSVFREDKARAFRSAVGVLNTMHPAEVNGVNVRLFEAAGCGGAVLTEFRPSVPELFTVGEEILAFQDFDELVDQATRLLNDNELAGRLGDAAVLRAHRDHSYDVRVTSILEKIW